MSDLLSLKCCLSCVLISYVVKALKLTKIEIDIQHIILVRLGLMVKWQR